MDYKGLKNEYETEQNRRKKQPVIILVMAAIIVVQFITIVSLWAVGLKTRAMFNEALDTNITMQEEINNLKIGGQITENGEDLYAGGITD